MRPVSTPVDERLASLSADARPAMQQLDGLIVAAMPGRSRVLWGGVFWGGSEQSIIGYGDLVQPRPRGESMRWFVVGLARQSSSFSVYVNAVEDGRYLLAQYAGRLGRAAAGSARLSFRRLEDLELETFTQMLGRAHELCPPDPG